MKVWIFSLMLFFLLMSLCTAQVIDVNIREVIDIEALNIDYNSTISDGKPFKVRTELYNVGSVEYTTRVRLDVLDKEDVIFTGWGDERYFFPGNQKIFDLYWYPPNAKNNFKAVISMYYANEMKKVKLIKFDVKSSEKTPENIFEILDFRTYEDEVEFLLKTNKTAENVIIIPSNYPIDWLFEQAKIDEMGSGTVKIVSIKYKPSIWRETSVTIDIVSEDGKYHTSQSFTMKRETAFWESVYRLINNLRVYLKF